MNKVSTETETEQTANNKEVSSSDLLCKDSKKDIDFEPEENDNNLYAFFKITHRNLKPSRGLCLVINSNDLNEKHVSHQFACLAESGTKTLLYEKLISE